MAFLVTMGGRVMQAASRKIARRLSAMKHKEIRTMVIPTLYR